MSILVQNVGEGSDSLKQSALVTIGYICETQEPELRENLSQHSNAILTAVVQGARKEETNNDVRYAAINALGDSLDFVRTNFENEGERNYIMQVVCEATQSTDFRIQQGAFGCLNRIMSLYYDKMKFYMEKALFGLTIVGMKQDEEDVAKLAVEFWCTVCEEEISIEDDNIQVRRIPKSEIHVTNSPQAVQDGVEQRPLFGFAKIATTEVVPVLLELMTKIDEDASDDDYTLSRAAYQCLTLYSQCVGGIIIAPVLQFVERNLRAEEWQLRDAAVSAFGAIMEGPEFKMLDGLVKQALPVIISMMEDKNVIVKDSAAYTLGRICECAGPAIDPVVTFTSLINALFRGLNDHPKMASSCCWALINLAERFGPEAADASDNPLSAHFEGSITNLLAVTERTDADNSLRTAAYEVLNAFVMNVGQDQLPTIAKLASVILERLEKSISLQSQIVSNDDKITLEEMQSSLNAVLMTIIVRLDKEITPLADKIMHILLSLLHVLPSSSIVPETIFSAIASLSNALEEDFAKYMDAFVPFLYNALRNEQEQAQCSIAIGIVSDIARSIGNKAAPYCDNFMNHLLNNLKVNILVQVLIFGC